MGLRRGFKAEAGRLAIRVRTELGLGERDRLDLEKLSKNLEVPVVSLSSLSPTCGDHVRQLTHTDPGAFSAVTVPCGGKKKIILHNDRHSVPRQRSNVTHEFSHILLEHPMTLPLDESGCRRIDRDVEDEANWLAGVLLIPDAAAVHVVRSGLAEDEACEFYGVSRQMLTFRINKSGARVRVARYARQPGQSF
jgi:IrrE N-terminal-like domain